MSKYAKSVRSVDMLTTTLAYARHGWAVLPIRARGKKPLTAHGVKDASTDPDIIQRWWRQWPDANVGISCGSVSGGLVVLDVDQAEMRWQLEKTHGPLPKTRVVRTGRGTHHYFLSPEPIRTQEIVSGLEVRGEGAYVLAPPSLHPNGKRYELLDDCDPAPLPDALRALLSKPSAQTTAALGAAAPEVEKVREGARNLTLASLAGSMRRRGMSREAIRAALTEENRQRCDPPLPESEVTRIARSVARYRPATAEKKSTALPAPPVQAAQASVPAPAVATGNPSSDPVDGAALLRDLETFLTRFVLVPPGVGLTLAAWIVTTYIFLIFDVFPYLAITSPVPRCGKTTLLDLIGLLAWNPTSASNISEAALFRTIEEDKPTILLDETEWIQQDSERAQVVRNMLNAGHRCNAIAIRCEKDGSRKRFSVYCPKALASIGELNETLSDRSILIVMQRAAPNEEIDRFRFRSVRHEADPLRPRIANWLLQNRSAVDQAYGALPDLEFLDARAADNWAPLFAVVAVADPSRTDELRRAAQLLSGNRAELAQENSLPLRLLADATRIARSFAGEVLPTGYLIAEVRKIEDSPWIEEDVKLSGRKVARWLRPFGLTPVHRRVGSETVRGYPRLVLLAVAGRYGIVETDQTAQAAQTAQPSNCKHLGVPYVPDVPDGVLRKGQ